ncbi:MAG: TIM44-like domain-containing protein [Clostridia bacterium]|nr:TIM44-like domain-containing protein [Clostridia bacterium]
MSGRNGDLEYEMQEGAPEEIPQVGFPPLHAVNLSELRKKEPEFSSGRFIKWGRELFWQFANASEEWEIEPIRPYLTEGFYRSCQNRCQDLQKRGVKIVYEQRIEQNIAITGYRVQNQQEYLAMALQVYITFAMIDVRTGRRVDGKRSTSRHMKYELEFMRQTAGDMPDMVRGGCCPHCGAPVENDRQERCSYCREKLIFEPKTENCNWLLGKCTEKRYE